MDVTQALIARALPAIPDRTEIIETLSTEVFGEVPSAAGPVNCTTIESTIGWLAGKADHHHLEIAIATEAGPFSLPITLTIADPTSATVMLINFGRIPHEYCPLEELIDAGVNVCVIDYRDVTSDDGDFSSGLAGLVLRPGERPWGKIALWAWAASRVLDHLTDRDDLDPSRIWVAGHSRLGKTALWAAATDPRFAGAIANNSGCSGAALARGNTGETIADITGRFGYWFTPSFAGWAGREQHLPWDQHWLLAAISPRPVLIGSAVDDAWADPTSEYLACVAASAAWQDHGLTGLAHLDEPTPSVGRLSGGAVQYHLRPGSHFLSRTDWAAYLPRILGH